MKWLPPAGSTQGTADGRYVIVQANSKDWVAYQLGYTVSKEIGTRDSDLKARAACEAYEAQLIAARKTA